MALAVSFSAFPLIAGPTEIRDDVGRMDVLPGNLERYTGLVVCAPHADYDAHTGEIVGWIHEQTDIPAVRAWGYRRPDDLVWYDVNRPCTRLPVSGELEEMRSNTPEAFAIYETYQDSIYEAAGLPEAPVTLLVDIHGHGARYTRADGTRARLEVVEAVGTGFTDEQVNAIKDEYERLCEEHELENAAPMVFYQTDPYYLHDGVEVDFTWTASGARQQGALRPDLATYSLHFENPNTNRAPEERRRKVALIYADLIEFVWSEILQQASVEAVSE